ncbi:RNA ligase family protein [Pseudoalteromonas rubra]|uniref:RNA ligase family protein n=1 Tax=Pseudoalteromonas rubra TaxID=43658 RepID=UPI002DBBD045|nr:RNA ligase family protein [Pseudoalteromonas rubra]MEC4087184.1 RNA ligase family protein [Pseudoalteromonas rubra]
MRYKYPRTPHLPWSLGATSDDLRQGSVMQFEGKKVVVTEKMDGENTTLYADYLHARSIDSRFHPSRAWVKSLQGKIGYQIPRGWRICGENLYARHSIEYSNLKSFFLAFSVWNDRNICLSWQDTQLFLKQLGLASPKVLYSGLWCETQIRQIKLDLHKQEGYVVRLADSFHYEDFAQSVAKWVRADHVTTDTHWMHSEVVPNSLVSQGE